LSGSEYRTAGQNQAIEEQLRKKYGAQLDNLPAWRAHSQQSKMQFEETARRSAEELLSTDPNMPESVVSIDPKTGQAGVDPDRYRVYQNAQKQQLDQNKQRIEAAKPIFEKLNAAIEAQASYEGSYNPLASTAGMTSSMQAVQEQAKLADAITGGTLFSDALRGTPQQAYQQLLQAITNPPPKAEPQAAQSNAPAPEVMAGMADMAESKLLPAGEEVILPGGRTVKARPSPFSGGQFSVPDSKPQGLSIKPNASQPQRNVFVFDAEYAGKQYAIPPHIKAALEENPSLAESILPQFEKKAQPKSTAGKDGYRKGKAPAKPKAKPTIEYQGKTYEVSEVMAEAAKKNPELTQYFIGAK
jgi:hypothetical protein